MIRANPGIAVLGAAEHRSDLRGAVTDAEITAIRGRPARGIGELGGVGCERWTVPFVDGRCGTKCRTRKFGDGYQDGSL
jgi:hypothetical protein